MRINGKKLNPYIVIIPVIRQDGDIIFKAKSVLDYKRFDELYPKPKPPMIQRAGSSDFVPDFTDTNYDLSVADWSKKRTAWMIIESLSATPIEWELVKPNDPNTWTLWEQEFDNSGLSIAEQNRLVSGVMEAQGLDEGKIEEARNRFLQSQAPEANT